jgi:hypothetical protein
MNRSKEILPPSASAISAIQLGMEFGVRGSEFGVRSFVKIQNMGKQKINPETRNLEINKCYPCIEPKALPKF